MPAWSRAARSRCTTIRCWPSWSSGATRGPKPSPAPSEALTRFEILGLTTNLPFLAALVADDAFVAGRLDTSFIERELARLTAPQPVPSAVLAAAAWQAAYRIGAPSRCLDAGPPGRSVRHDPRMARMSRRYDVRADGSVHPVEVLDDGTVRVGAETLRVEPLDDTRCRVTHADGTQSVIVRAGTAAAPWLFASGQAWQLKVDRRRRPARAGAASTGEMIAPMPATVVAIAALPGATVTAGDPVVVLEAMKMELVVRAPRDGVVAAVHCRVGELVATQATLAELAP